MIGSCGEGFALGVLEDRVLAAVFAGPSAPKPRGVWSRPITSTGSVTYAPQRRNVLETEFPTFPRGVFLPIYDYLAFFSALHVRQSL
jgi:hypothetical protein